MSKKFTISQHEELTAEYARALQGVIHNAETPYEAAKSIARDFLGARKLAPSSALFGFWVPGLVQGALQGKSSCFYLECFTPLESINFRALKQGNTIRAAFQRDEIPLTSVNDYMISVLDGVQAGTRDRSGTFYWLRYNDGETRHIIRDPLVSSTPFGVYAPGELFDVAGMLADRKDIAFFKSWYRNIHPDGSYRARDIGTHLEIHTETATEEGTFEALTRRYQQIGEKIQANLDADSPDMYAGLSPADLNFIGFDSIELTPEVPPAEREAVRHRTGEFFQYEENHRDQITVTLKHPDISNWGYDTPLLGSAAINPSLLGTLRPNEFLEFIETIHTMPGRPIQLCIDSVLGHCDFQGARLLQTFDQPCEDRQNPKYIRSAYLRGPNMYGRDIDFSEPNVKAILLELLIRKINYGFDCVRVDGAQDFIIEMDEETGLRIQDDDFLNEMSNVVQDINGLQRRLDMNLEDGRPWPDDLNWLYNSKYLDHTIERTLSFGDRVKQWSPIIFAHNVHGKFKWFMNKWNRFVEVFRYGENWITGHSNHDNARYFYRMTMMKPASQFIPGDDFADYYNDQLGETMTEAAHNAMDNNALTALSLGFLPGNPMFLLNALFHTPWLFMRDIDATYDVKIVGDEGSRFLTWYVNEDLYQQADKFQRIKDMGFTEYRQLVAPVDQKGTDPGFMDVLFRFCQAIKTDAVMARVLFESPDEEGGFKTLEELQNLHKSILQPSVQPERDHRRKLQDRIDQDPKESARRVKAARKLIGKNKRFLERDLPTAPEQRQSDIQAQLDKIHFLEDLPNHHLALLIEDADLRTEYNVDTWSKDPALNRLAPQAMKPAPAGQLTPQTLKAFARAFMHDARDAARVPQYAADVDPSQAAFNFKLRRFRQENHWLLKNPTNDVQRDYFHRKLITNGAKDLGDWGDKGDIIKCNTIYYGWRTSPNDRMQVFIIANMEGKPLDRLPLNLFLNLKGRWQVVAHSPTLENIPEILDENFVIENFKNGQVLLLSRPAPVREEGK